MEIKIDKSFHKDTRQIKDKTILQKIANTIANVQRAEDIQDIKKPKKVERYSIHVSYQDRKLFPEDNNDSFLDLINNL